MGNPDGPPNTSASVTPPAPTAMETGIDEIQPIHNNAELDILGVRHDQDSNHEDENTSLQPATAPITTPLAAALYTSHFLSTWNSRLFEFGAVLFLASIYQTTLRPMSIYALVRSASAILFSPAVGLWIDRGNRLSVVRVSIVGQRVAVAASCVIFWFMVARPYMSRTQNTALFALAIILACIEKLCAVMNLVAVERDWIVVITEDNESARRVMNARMRRIDLFCKLVGPLAISLINGASTVIAIWTTLGMSVVSILIEYVCIERVYKMVPRLQRSPNATSTAPMGEGQQEPSNWSTKGSVLHLFSRMKSIAVKLVPVKSLPFYFRHAAFIPSFSLSLLYFTVLSFSGPMITFLLFSGYNSFHVGIARTVSTVFELSATWIAPRLSKRIGVVRGGLWFLNSEMLWLTGGVCWYLARYYRDPRETMVVTASGLVAAVALSRVGLWGFDLCAQNIIQDCVDFDHRGSFSSVEASFQNFFELLSYVSTIVFARPDQFQWPSIMSLGAVYMAGGLFMVYARRERGHLMHRPQCLDVKIRSRV